MKIPNKIDLHGLTTQQGYNKSLMFVKLNWMNGIRNCKIITGISGKMRKEFPYWIESEVFKSYVESVKEFDGHGSFLLKIKKNEKIS